MFRNLWKDEAGFIVSAELVLVATIVVIGLVVGLAVLRNQVVQELVDVGLSIGSVSQSFALSGTLKEGVAWSDGSCYVDLRDFCQGTQDSGFEPGSIVVRNLMPAQDWNHKSIPSNGRPTFGEAP